MMNKQELFIQLQNGSSQALSVVYKKYRGEFINWSVSTYSITRDDAKDIYQSCIIIFYENILTGKLTSINSSFKTYLFGIGKNKIRENLRLSNKIMAEAEPKADEIRYEEDAEQPEKEQQYKIFKTCLDELGDPCKSLLIYFYYKNFTMREIAESLHYKNEATAKNSKYKCLQRLKDCFFSKTEMQH